MDAGISKGRVFPDQQARGAHYGKLMVYDDSLYATPPVLPDGPTVELQHLRIAYTISDSTPLNSGAVVGIVPGPSARERSVKRLVWSEHGGLWIEDPARPGALYDLGGSRRDLPAPVR